MRRKAMKRIAVVIYEGFSMFEFSVALEILAMSSQYAIDIFGEERKNYRSEEGLLAVSEYDLHEMKTEDYEGIILTGFSNENPTLVHNQLFMEKIQEFDREHKMIAAISATPVFLIKAGVLKDYSFMCGCPKDGLKEEGFTDDELKFMVAWEECVKQYDTLKFIRHDNIITSVAYGYREWAIEIGNMLGIKTYPRSFGLS